MKTLAQFKAEQGLSKIELLQGTGRKYAQVNDVQLVVSSKCDLTKPCFVTNLNEKIDEAGEFTPENSKIVPGVYLVINASVKAVEVI